MEKVLTEEDKKFLRFIAHKYLPSLGMDFANLDLSVDEWDMEIKIFQSNHFSNNYSAEIPEKLMSIFEKIIEYSQQVIEKPDIDVSYQTAEITIYPKSEKIELVFNWYYYEEGDSSFDSWSYDDDESVAKILDMLESKFPDKEILVLTYNGSGDSGFIESDFDSGEKVPDDVEDWCYRILENYHGGWEINEGSRGEFTFNLKTSEIELTHINNVEGNDSKTLFEETFSKNP